MSLSYIFDLQVPGGDWTGAPCKDDDIPCRRMRSGSYIKAMGDADSEDSEGSPQPSPKTAARRQSYLKATQQSLSEQSTTQRYLERDLTVFTSDTNLDGHLKHKRGN